MYTRPADKQSEQVSRQEQGNTKGSRTKDNTETRLHNLRCPEWCETLRNHTQQIEDWKATTTTSRHRLFICRQQRAPKMVSGHNAESTLLVRQDGRSGPSAKHPNSKCALSAHTAGIKPLVEWFEDTDRARGGVLPQQQHRPTRTPVSTAQRGNVSSCEKCNKKDK